MKWFVLSLKYRTVGRNHCRVTTVRTCGVPTRNTPEGIDQPRNDEDEPQNQLDQEATLCHLLLLTLVSASHADIGIWLLSVTVDDKGDDNP